MIFVFYLLAAVLIFLSFRSFRGGIAYLGFVRGEFEKPLGNYTPFVTVIAPCRGLDDDLAENLRCLVDQNYPSYEILFVVDDENDGAIPIIDQISHHGSNMIIALALIESLVLFALLIVFVVIKTVADQ